MTGSGRARDHWAHGTRPGSRRVRPGRLMAFASANCQREADEWALIERRATRLAMVLSGPDFGGPLFLQGQVGSGDVLVRTIRQVAEWLSSSHKPTLADSFAAFIGHPAYNTDILCSDLHRYAFLLGASDGQELFGETTP